MPRAYIEMILSSKPVNRVCPLATILGSKLACRSRGVSSSSSPKSPFSALRPIPLRLLPLWCPAGSCFSNPKWSLRFEPLRSGCRQQPLANQEQVHQSARHKQSVRVLVQSAIAHLDESELQLHHREHVFHLGAYAALGTVLLSFYFIDMVLVAIALVGKVQGVRSVFPQHLTLPAIRLIAPHPRFCAVEQVR